LVPSDEILCPTAILFTAITVFHLDFVITIKIEGLPT